MLASRRRSAVNCAECRELYPDHRGRQTVAGVASARRHAPALSAQAARKSVGGTREIARLECGCGLIVQAGSAEIRERDDETDAVDLCVTWAVAVVLSVPLCPRRSASGAAKLPLNGHSGPLKVWRALLARQLENPPGREALGGSNPSPSALRSGNFASRLESIARRQNSKL